MSNSDLSILEFGSRGICRLALLALLAAIPLQLNAVAPLCLNPENPHYFLFRGKPEIIITSGEHYGAVINLDFDYVKYLDTLARDHLNGTRTWAGAYCESPAAFNISSNTLAPAPGRFICPWARSGVPGYANGGNKFDLTEWDSAYFSRLKDFVARARQRGIIVELNLFCPFYDESMWRLSPMNAANNINGVGALARTNVYRLEGNGGLLPFQEAMVRKIVSEMKDYDNLYYEICNEPYFGGVTLDWQRHIAGVIARSEKSLGVSHLISQNIANGRAKVKNPFPEVSILNFHYAYPPDAVAMNYGLDRVIGYNETGFRGTNNAPYRIAAWDFIVAGGGLFNNLDYSFTAGHEDGTFVYPANQPGGGNPVLRKQLAFLSDVIRQFDFVHMRPDNEVLAGGLPRGLHARALVQPGKAWLVYLQTAPKRGDARGADGRKTGFADGAVSLGIKLPAGHFKVQWLDTRLCATIRSEGFSSGGGIRKLPVPAFAQDIALAVRKQ
jgi:Cellulase (glycosyl hydrolase family 5)